MNLAEVQTILGVLGTALDRQIPEGMDTVWAATLADVPYGLARIAVIESLKSSPYLPKPSEIRQRAELLAEAQRREADRQHQLSVERSRATDEAPRSDGYRMVAFVLARLRAAGSVPEEGKRLGVERANVVAAEAIAEWRKVHPTQTFPSRAGEHCGRASCRCTHSWDPMAGGVCDGGWIEVDPGPDGNDQVRACPTCNHRRSSILKAGDTRRVTQANLRDLSYLKDN